MGVKRKVLESSVDCTTGSPPGPTSMAYINISNPHKLTTTTTVFFVCVELRTCIRNDAQLQTITLISSCDIRTYTEEEHGIPTPCPGPMQEVDPSPERKTSARLVSNVLSHCVGRLQRNNTTISFTITT